MNNNNNKTQADTDDFDIQKIYEDDEVLVLNKPVGLAVHPDGRTEESTLAGWVVENYPEVREVGESIHLSDGRIIERPGIVHRLDRETSGAIAIAKTIESFEYLKRQFQERKVQKIYHAFIYGAPPTDIGMIDSEIGRSKKDFRKWTTGEAVRGERRVARTDYRVLRHGSKASFLEVRPYTGRTHQIRVHFNSIKHPVICDRLYAPRREVLFGFERLALHARSLLIEVPNGKHIEAVADYTEDFLRAIEAINTVDK